MNAVALTSHADVAQKLEEQKTITIKERNASQTASKRLSELSEQKTTIDASLKEERLKTENLQVENESLKANLQAKKEAEAKAVAEAKIAKAPAPAAVKPTQAAPARVAVAGNCGDWLAQAGITDTASAMTLIQRESGCNPNAVNPGSGACGVAQELPCGKSGCSLGDGACQVAWMRRYVEGRYGSFASALGHSNSVGWY